MSRKFVFFFALLFFSSSFASSVDTFTKGKYSLYGKLKFSYPSNEIRLLLYPDTTRQYTITLKMNDKKRAILYNNKFVQIDGNIGKESKGIQTIVHDAIIVKSVPQSLAAKKAFSRR